MVLHDRCKGLGCPGTIYHPITQLRVPYEVVASEVLSMVFGNVDCNLSSSEVEYSLLWLGGEELHIVCRGDLAKDVSVVENGLIEDIVIFASALSV